MLNRDQFLVEFFHKPREHRNIEINNVWFLNTTLSKQQNVWIHIFVLLADIADPMRLLKDMRTEGLTLKQNVLGRVFDPGDPNQVRSEKACVWRKTFSLIDYSRAY